MARHRALEMFGRSGNPAFKSKAFTHRSSDFSTNEVMTLSGAVNKTGLYLFLCVLSASWTWNIFFKSGDPSSVTGLMIFGLIGGFIAAMVTIFKPTAANISAPIYALLQGLAIGGISAMYESAFALLNFKSCASVLTAINSTPCRLFSIISLIAFPPAPPTPRTNSRGCNSFISGALKLIVILFPLVIV